MVGESGISGTGLVIVLGQGNGNFTTAPAFSVFTVPESSLVADVNGDGKPDVVWQVGTPSSSF